MVRSIYTVDFCWLVMMRRERRGTRNQVYGEPYRGFESLPLRQFLHFQIQRLTPQHWFPIKSLSVLWFV